MPRPLQAFNTIYSRGIRAVVGGSRSSLAEPLSLLGSVYGIPLVSYWASSASLSNKAIYPYFGRTYQSDAYTVKALLTIMRDTFAWHNMAVIYARDAYGNNYANGLGRNASDFELTVLRSVPYEPFSGTDGTLSGGSSTGTAVTAVAAVTTV